jgi:hypothetical protein
MPDLPRTPRELLPDQLSEQFDRTRQLLAGNPEELAEATISRMGAEFRAEALIASQLAAIGPLVDVQAFPAAHRRTMRALEVLDREGFRNPPVGRAGPLAPIAEPVVEFVAEYIVKSFAESVAGRLRTLYARREAQSRPGSEERQALARARIEMDRLAPGFNGGGVTAPLLVVFGAAVPLVAGLGKSIGAIDFGSRPVWMAMTAILLVVSLLASWVLLHGAAVAHRRSGLIMKEPLAALWETIGHAGNPPRDNSVQFAAIAVTLTTVAWFVIPVAVGLAIVFR